MKKLTVSETTTINGGPVGVGTGGGVFLN